MDDGYKHPNDEKKVKFRSNMVGSGKDKKSKWILIITFVSFILSALLSYISSAVLKGVDIFVAFVVVLLIIIVNILFDIIGTAVTAADEVPFHAMASRKLYGAKQAIKLVRNADKVSNFCNDVIGDICGVISGAASAYIIMKIAGSGVNSDTTIAGLAISGMVAALTVGGKAAGKSVAIRNSNYIVYKAGVVMKFLLFGDESNKTRDRKRK